MKNKKFKNKYRISSMRLQTWDYAKKAKYHITICTKNMKHFFGHIENEKMILSEAGQILLDVLNELPNKFKFVKLDEFQIMPNHFHLIIIIEDKVDSTENESQNELPKSPEIITNLIENLNDLDVEETCHEDSEIEVENEPDKDNTEDEQIPILKIIDDIPDFENSIKKRGGITGEHNLMLNENLSTVIRFFKGKATFLIHKVNKSFEWQSNFYDTIIRNQIQLERTRNYIRNNCKKWGK